MRTVIQLQMKLGETDIAAIVIDPKSRDDTLNAKIQNAANQSPS